MNRYAYALPILLILPAFAAMIFGGWLTWFLPVFTYGLLPLLDQVSRGSERNYSPEEEQERLSDRWYDRLLYLFVVLQFAILGAFLWRMSVGGFATWEIAGAVATMGVACVGFGINLGHELGHHRETFDQRMAKAALLSTLYMHFFVEHNRGHHRRAATPDDPATSRRGESLWAYLPRTIVGGWRSAWELENSRLERKGVPWYSWQNEIVRATVIQAAFVTAIGLVFGPFALGGFLVAATIGFSTLEAVNYIEHYGLVRGQTEHGGYERVRPHHSWNSNRPVGRLLLFDLTRHSDHHANATRRYQILRHMDDVPELPFGYTGMIMLALVPPLFFRVMDPLVDDWEARYKPQAAAA